MGAVAVSARRHPDFQHPFGIADWNGVRARVRRGPDGRWWMTLWRGNHCILFPGSADHLSWYAAMDQANRVMTAARRVLAGEI